MAVTPAPGARAAVPGLPTSAVLPGLTGLRALAVGVVVLGHLVYSRVPSGLGVDAVNLAGLGVQVFFVLSGFLITTLLMREQDDRGRVALGRFYLRRAVRLLPPLYALLAAMAALGALGAVTIGVRDLLAAGLQLTNYFGNPSHNILWHTWSLAVEEHFYLVLPVLLVLLSRRRLIAVSIAVVALSPLVRMASYVVLDSAREIASFQTHNRLDALFLGALMALCWSAPWLQRLAATAARPLYQLTALLLLLGTVRAETLWHGRFMSPVGYTLQAVLIAGVIAGLQVRSGALRTLLETRILVHVGVISYSVYLWQQLFTLSAVGHWWSALPVAILGPFLAAEVSYRLIERPLQSVRARLHSPRLVAPTP